MSTHLEDDDRASAAVAVGPRVALSDIQQAIAHVVYQSGWGFTDGSELTVKQRESLGVLTICLVVMKNGFTVIGKAAPASPENYNFEVGRKFAYEDAIRQIWPLMGFALKDRLHEDKAKRPS